MSIQTDIDSMIGGISVFNLALNVAGIINNRKNVALYVLDDNTGRKINILEGSLGRLSGITNLAGKIDDTGVVLSAEVIENCRLTEHPLEDGKVLADNKIILPTEINVQVTLPIQDYKDKLEAIKQYKENNQMIYIETKFGSYKNMQIINMPCNMNINNINRLSFTIKFKEVLVAEKSTNTTENVSDGDTVNTGTQTGTEQNLKSVV